MLQTTQKMSLAGGIGSGFICKKSYAPWHNHRFIRKSTPSKRLKTAPKGIIFQATAPGPPRTALPGMRPRTSSFLSRWLKLLFDTLGGTGLRGV